MDKILWGVTDVETEKEENSRRLGTTLIQKDALIQSHYLPTMGGQLVVTSDEDVNKLHNLVL